MQICLIYFQSSVLKCAGPNWLNGTVVHYILFLREFASSMWNGWRNSRC